MRVVAARRSVREFDSSREINDSTLGQLLWMSVGVNRPRPPSASGAASGRSNPTARNWQGNPGVCVRQNGVWEYRPVSHTLVLVKEGDHRSLVAGTKSFSQDFVMDAPCSIVFVADMTRLPEGGHVGSMALVDAGIACENLNLACVSEGVATVPAPRWMLPGCPGIARSDRVADSCDEQSGRIRQTTMIWTSRK